MSNLWRKVTGGVACLDLMWNLVLLAYLFTIQAPIHYLLSIELQQILFLILSLIQIYSAARLFLASMQETTSISAIGHIRVWKRIFVSFTLIYFVILCGTIWLMEEGSLERWWIQYGIIVFFIRLAAFFGVQHFKNLVQMSVDFPLNEVLVLHKNLPSKNTDENTNGRSSLNERGTQFNGSGQ